MHTLQRRPIKFRLLHYKFLKDMPPKKRKGEHSNPFSSPFTRIPSVEDKQPEETASVVESTIHDVSFSATNVIAAETLPVPEPVLLAEGNDNIASTADIGHYINATMTNQEVDNIVRSMPRGKSTNF